LDQEQIAQEFWRSLLGIKGSGKHLAALLPTAGIPAAAARTGMRVAREGGRNDMELVLTLAKGAGLSADTQAFTDQLIRTDPHVASVLFERAIFFDQIYCLLSAWQTSQLQVTDDLVLAKAIETIPSLSPFVPALASFVNPVRRLADLLDFAKYCSGKLQEDLARKAAEFFDHPPEQVSFAQDWIRLYEHVRKILGDQGKVPSLELFLRVVLNQMAAIHEFPDILPFLDGHPLHSSFSVALVALAEKEMDEIILTRGSSSDVRSSIQEIREALSMYSIQGAVDMSKAEELVDELSAEEDNYADLYQDEYKEQMYDARVEERSVDETLNSLLN
jgi:hypothetical protein